MFAGRYNLEARSKAEHKGPVVTAQIDYELWELVKIYDELEPHTVLEIGSQWGGTLYYWLEGAADNSIIANIDILQGMSEQDRERLPKQWQSWCPVGCKYHPFIGRSDDPDIFEQVFSIMPEIDFLFIDAVHTYEGAKHDFEKYGALVRSGGVIALHDLVTPSFSPHIQVWQLWREIQVAGYKTREIRAGADYGGIGIVYV